MPTGDTWSMPPPTPEELQEARAVMGECSLTAFASASESGRGWPEHASLWPIVRALREAEQRGIERAALECEDYREDWSLDEQGQAARDALTVAAERVRALKEKR